MRKINIAKIIWVSSIFIILIIVLLLVMNYKINYQYLTHYKLYFYDCSGNLCVTEVEDNSNLLYSKYDCGYEECPVYLKNLQDTYAVLKKDSAYILYNYRTSHAITQDYHDYQVLNDKYLIVTKSAKKGIIDINGNIIIAPKYEEIGDNTKEYLSGYNLNYIIAKKDDKYGIISFKTGEVIEEFKYTKEEIDKHLLALDKD